MSKIYYKHIILYYPCKALLEGNILQTIRYKKKKKKKRRRKMQIDPRARKSKNKKYTK